MAKRINSKERNSNITFDVIMLKEGDYLYSTLEPNIAGYTMFVRVNVYSLINSFPSKIYFSFEAISSNECNFLLKKSDEYVNLSQLRYNDLSDADKNLEGEAYDKVHYDGVNKTITMDITKLVMETLNDEDFIMGYTEVCFKIYSDYYGDELKIKNPRRGTGVVSGIIFTNTDTKTKRIKEYKVGNASILLDTYDLSYDIYYQGLSTNNKVLPVQVDLLASTLVPSYSMFLDYKARGLMLYNMYSNIDTYYIKSLIKDIYEEIPGLGKITNEDGVVIDEYTEIYFNYEDFSYIYTSPFNDFILINGKKKIVFTKYNDYSLYKLSKIKYDNNTYISFTWNVDKLSKIVSSYGNEVNFVYENNKLKRIIFTKENKEINIITQGQVTKIYTKKLNSSETVKTNIYSEIEITRTQTKETIIDKSTNYSYTVNIAQDGKVTSVNYDEGLTNCDTYTQSENRTIIQNSYNEVTKLYFNEAKEIRMQVTPRDEFVAMARVVSKDLVTLNKEKVVKLDSNILDESFYAWIKENCIVNYYNDGEILDYEALKILPFPDDTSYIYKEIETNGTSLDTIVFNIFGKANFSCNQRLECIITLYNNDSICEKHTSYFDYTTTNYQVINKVICPKQSYTKIRIEIAYNGTGYLCLCYPQLSINKKNVNYTYGLRGEVEGMEAGRGECNYDYEDNNIIRKRYSSGEIVDIEYDSYDRIICLRNDYRRKRKEYVYDAFGNIIKIKDVSRGTETNMTYDTKGNLLTEESNMGKVEYTYNAYSDLVKVKYSSGISKEITYTDYQNISKCKMYNGLISETNQITYNSDYEVTSLKAVSNESVEYSYDVYRRLKKVEKNGIILDTYEYNSKKNNKETSLITKSNKEREYSYNYSYDNYDRLSKIVYKDNDIYSFTYDSYDRLIKIKDHRLEKERVYVYDENDNISEEKLTKGTNNQVINYLYDNNNRVQRKVINENGKVRAYDYEYKEEFIPFTYDGFIEKIVNKDLNDKLIANKDLVLLYGDKPKVAKYKLCEIEKEGRSSIGLSENGYVSVNIDSVNSKRIDGKYYGKNNYDKEYYLNKFASRKELEASVKVNGEVTSEINLLSFESNNVLMCSLVLKTDNKLYIRVKDSSDLNTNITFALNKWNYLKIITDSRYLEYIYNDQSKIININGSYVGEVNYFTLGKTGQSKEQEEKVIDEEATKVEYQYIGIGCTGTTQLKLYTHKDIESKTGVKYYTNDLKGFDVITLNGLLESVKGIKPIGVTDKDIFGYDEITKRIVFNAKEYVKENYTTIKPTLCYDLGLKTKGTIILMVKPDSSNTNSKRYILSSVTEDKYLFNIYIDRNYNINLEYYENRSNTTLTSKSMHYMPLDKDRWNKIAITYDPINIYIKVNGQNNIRYVHYNLGDNHFDLTNAHTYIGCKPNLSNEGEYFFNGQIQMVSFIEPQSSLYLNLNTIFDNMDLIEENKISDEIGRVVKRQLKKGDNELNKRYRYHDKESSYVQNDVILSEHDYKGNEIIYTYDEGYNITKKVIVNEEGTFIEGFCYEYDKLARLTKEKHYKEENVLDYSIEYEYNIYGNILKKTETKESEIVIYTYTYSITNNDELLKITKTTTGVTEDLIDLSYASYKCNPSTIKINNVNNSITYEHGKVTGYGEYTYTYDELSRRVSKKKNGLEVEYIYEGSNIVKTRETAGQTTEEIEYHYDEENQIIGLTYKDKEYFYDRTIDGLINRIIDITGKEYVRYKYTAYGEVIKEINSSLTTKEKQIANGLKEKNIFIYKGYCYDEETNLYYLNARYYSPIICRFISYDDIEYLDYESINGLNLYCYCFNNPVNYKQRLVSSDSSIIDLTFSGTLGVGFIPIVGVIGGSSGIFNQTLKGAFRNGLLFGNGSITSFYADWNARAQISLKKGTFKVGIAGKFSILNVSGQVGFGTKDLNLSLKTVGDALTVSGMAGIFIDPKENTYFTGVELKATALSVRVGGQLDIFGLQIEAGLSGELGSIGGRLGIGLKPTNDGKMEFYFHSGLAHGVGCDFYIRIRFDGLF